MQGCVLRPLCAGESWGATAIEEHRRAFLQFKAGVVGLAGLEPAASFLSAIFK
jgi:hypothetical protein